MQIAKCEPSKEYRYCDPSLRPLGGIQPWHNIGPMSLLAGGNSREIPIWSIIIPQNFGLIEFYPLIQQGTILSLILVGNLNFIQ